MSSSTALALGPPDEARYGWPGGDQGVIDGACASIARRLVRAGLRAVGVLPAAGALLPGAAAAPLVAALARAVPPFVSEALAVAVVDSWPTWPWGQAMQTTDTALYRTRPLLGESRLVEIAPIPCGDVEAATAALAATLRDRPPNLAMVLVNLAGYAAPGRLPAGVDALDGVVLVAGRRRTSAGGLARLANAVGPRKNLGTILVD